MKHWSNVSLLRRKNRQNNGVAHPKKAKTVSSVGKVMASVFTYYLRGKNDQRRKLRHLYHKIKKKPLHLAKKKVLFHQDIITFHTSVTATVKINE